MLHQWIWVASCSLWSHCPTSNSHRRQGNVLYFADADPEFVAIHICLFPNFTLVESRVWSLPQAFHRPTWQDGRSILLITQMFPLQDILGVLTEQVPGYRSDINHPIKETNRMVKLSVYKEGSLLHHPTGIPQQILGHYSAKKQAVPDVTSWIRTGGFRVMKITKTVGWISESILGPLIHRLKTPSQVPTTPYGAVKKPFIWHEQMRLTRPYSFYLP